MMQSISRSHFIKMFGAIVVSPAIPSRAKMPPLSFSTLGCPDWSLEQIISFAAAHRYQGVEIRGLQRELDLPALKHFNSSQAISETKKMFGDKNIKIVALGSSCELHHADADKRQKNLDEGKRFADLAAHLECPYVRVFPNKLPADQDRDKTFALISQGLNALGDYAHGSGVKMLMETHGDLAKSDDILKVMSAVESPDTGLVWDVSNMWFTTHEAPAVVYRNLKKYILHTHIKDRDIVKGEDRTVLLGKGQVPIFEAIDLLVKNKYKGFFSFEWEKLWQPGIEAPEIALADYPFAMRKHFGL